MLKNHNKLAALVPTLKKSSTMAKDKMYVLKWSDLDK